MIEINGKKLSDGEEDTILMALYHYDIQWSPYSKYTKLLKLKVCYKISKRINKLIDKIVEDFPDEEEVNK